MHIPRSTAVLPRALLVVALVACLGAPSNAENASPPDGTPLPRLTIEAQKKVAGSEIVFHYVKTERYDADQNPTLASVRYERSSRRDAASQRATVTRKVSRVYRTSDEGVRKRDEDLSEQTAPHERYSMRRSTTLYREDSPGDVAWENACAERLASSALRVDTTARTIGYRTPHDGVSKETVATETWAPGSVPAAWRGAFRRDREDVLARFGPDVVAYKQTTVTRHFSDPQPDGTAGEITISMEARLRGGRTATCTLVKRLAQ